MAKRKTTEQKLSELDAEISSNSDAPLANLLSDYLKDRSHSVVAKAANIAAEKLCYQSLPELLQAYARFLKNATKNDKNCIAKKAIARALYELDYQQPTFFLAGLSYRQYEPVWGGQVDTAVDIRCVCALGLAASYYPRAMIALVQLLADAEVRARCGAVQAIALLEPYQAEVVLRSKILQGDEEPEVIGECFAKLLKIEPDHSPAFVANYLQDENAAIGEHAALSLGESRLPEAFNLLVAFWQRTDRDPRLNSLLLRAIALLRHDDAYQFLLSIIENNIADRMAIIVIEILAMYRYNEALQARIRQIVDASNDDNLMDVFKRVWLNPSAGGDGR